MSNLPKGDMRRVWLTLAALDKSGPLSILELSKITGLPRPTISDILIKVMDDQIPGVTVEKTKSKYSISEWVSIRHSCQQLLEKH